MNSFIGREHDLQRIVELLRTTRLLTLTGTGGVGKTRLALHVAQTLADGTVADGVWPVDLARLTDSRLVAQAVADGLGLKPTRVR